MCDAEGEGCPASPNTTIVMSTIVRAPRPLLRRLHLLLALLLLATAPSPVDAATSRRPNLGDLCSPGNKHLHAALTARADVGKNIVLAVSNGNENPAFVEMTRWFVRQGLVLFIS